ncbi:MAG: PqqD family protein [Polyangiaceae bacterium]|nr:PqqD family protein [Polyangiaceae bacterium]
MKRSFTIPSDVVSEVINGEAMLLNLSTGRYFSLNSTGAFIWRQLETHGDVGRIVGELAATYSLDERKAVEDVNALLSELTAQALITPYVGTG